MCSESVWCRPGGKPVFTRIFQGRGNGFDAAPLYWPRNQKRRSKKLKNALAALTLYSKDIAGCVTDMAEHNLNVHSSLRELRRGSEKFDELFRYYGKKYSVSR